jgi:hypothetical protein
LFLTSDGDLLPVTSEGASLFRPTIAGYKALATFFNCKVYGAKSGSSIEVKFKKAWISSSQYKTKVGHWPSGSLPHRLVPDKGTYYEYLP